jgi:Cytochrome c7 and related cytochrome c
MVRRRVSAALSCMPQIFQPPALLGVKLLLLGALFAVLIVWLTVYKALPAHSGLLSPAQPIPFSHKHHVGDDGIDCRYCHWSVEKSSFAGIPSTQVCLTCHSQLFSDAPMLQPLFESARTGTPIRWVRVHDLPDFVFFDHRIHIAKGVGCVECHGRVDRMPRIERVASLEMQWCLGCHRDPAPHLRPPEQVFDVASRPPADAQLRASLAAKLLPTQRLTDCSTCHR